MRALFLADAHLCKPEDQNYRYLLSFLAEEGNGLNYLFLLGDIFEFWIGKSNVYKDHQPIIDCLEQLVHEGTQLVYVEGNHDFHLGPVFSERLRCDILPDGGAFELDGKKIFVAHGDLANPNDTGYRSLRKLLRSSLIRRLIRILPSSLLMSIATRASDQSRKSSTGKRTCSPIEEILIPYAETQIRQGHQAVLTGHYHYPLHREINGGELVALGDWITQFSYALYENGRFELKRYSPESASPTSGPADAASS